MIILTGASGGLGHEILSSIANLDSVIAIYYQNPIVSSNLKNIIPYKLDITCEKSVINFVHEFKTKLNKITLIHAAAIAKQDNLSVNFKTTDWDDTMSVNLKGNFLLTRTILPSMINDGWGRIIHFSSAASNHPAPGSLAYSTSKSALIGMSNALGKEYARFGITSNVLINGYFDTGMYKKLTQSAQQKLLDSIPSKKLGNPLNIVNAIDFLMKSEFVNCSSIKIDGGL